MEPGGRGLAVHRSCASKIWGAWLEAEWCSGSSNIGIGIDINILGVQFGWELWEKQCAVY